MRLGLREANQQFGKVMRAVRGGEEVIVTEHGRPVAVISPYRDEEGLARLIHAGALRAPTAAPSPPSKPVRLRGGVKPSEFLEQDRDA